MLYEIPNSAQKVYWNRPKLIHLCVVCGDICAKPELIVCDGDYMAYKA